jgi:hypothetical protein
MSLSESHIEELIIRTLSKLSPTDIIRSEVIDHASIAPIFILADSKIGVKDLF